MADYPPPRALAVSGRKVDAALMDRLPGLELIANMGVGYDNIDIAAATARSIVVTNTPDVLTDEVADFTLGLLIMTVRRLGAAERFLRSGAWASGAFPLSPTLRTRKIGILGMGRIGKAVARRLEGFSVPISYFARHAQPELPYAYFNDAKAMAREGGHPHRHPAGRRRHPPHHRRRPTCSARAGGGRHQRRAGGPPWTKPP